MIDFSTEQFWSKKVKTWGRVDISSDLNQTLDFFFDSMIQRLWSVKQSLVRKFPCKNPENVGKLQAPWKIMSIILSYTYFWITLEKQKVMTLFLDNIVVKKSPLYLCHLILLLFNTELELQTYRMGSFWGLVQLD